MTGGFPSHSVGNVKSVSMSWRHRGDDNVYGLVQDCSNSSASAMELLQCYAKPSICDTCTCIKFHRPGLVTLAATTVTTIFVALSFKQFTKTHLGIHWRQMNRSSSDLRGKLIEDTRSIVLGPNKMVAILHTIFWNAFYKPIDNISTQYTTHLR